MTIPDGLVEQTEQCLRNIEAALAEAGAGLRDVVRVMYVLPNAAEFPQVWPVLRKYFAEVRPARHDDLRWPGRSADAQRNRSNSPPEARLDVRPVKVCLR